MDRDQFLKAVQPLEHVLDESGWTTDQDRAATHLLCRRLSDQAELRLSRVDAICDEAQMDDRDLKQSERREAERLQGEATAFGEALEEVKAVISDPERSRRRHLQRAPGPSAGLVQRAQRAPLALELPEAVVRELREAVAKGQAVSRQLSVTQLDPSRPAAANQRGRLVDFTTVREASGPQSAFLSVTATTPAAVVPEAGPKPEIATTDLLTPPHEKLAGYVDVTREQVVYGADVAQAVESVAVRQLITAENIALAAALAGATAVVAGTTPAQSILAGIASVAAGGGVPSVVAVAPADIASVLGEQSATAGYPVTGNATELATTLWGVPLVPALGLTAGTSFVWAREAVGTSVAQGPTVLVDPYSQSVNNVIRVVIEELVAFALIAPTAAAKVDLVAP